LYRLAAEAVPPKPPRPGLEWWQTAQFWLNFWATACLLLAVGVGIAAKIVESRKESKLEQTIDDQAEKLAGAKQTEAITVARAKLGQLVMVHDEIIPVASSIADMARYPLEDRGPYLKNVAQAAASALERLVSEHVQRPRAVIYSIDADADPVSMNPIGFKGRGKRPRPFRAGTTRGNAAIQFAFEAQPGDIWEDLTSEKPAGFDGSASDYRTFVSMPISTETGTYGMVSLDAPEPKSLADGDRALTEIIAEVMAIAFEVGQDQNTTGPDDDGEPPNEGNAALAPDE
jgi:GAF domain-containing protein